MYKVAMLYYAPINQMDGASKVVRSFADNKQIFEENDVMLDVYAPTTSNGASGQSGEKKSIRKVLKNLLFGIDVAGIIRGYYGFFVRGRKAVKLYQASGNTNHDVFFLHELTTCYNVIKLKKECKIVLVLHTGGDFFQILLKDYPLMRYTIFYNFFLKHVRKKVLKSVDKIVFNSKLAADNFKEIYTEVKDEIVTYVDNGIADFEKPEEHLVHPQINIFNIVCVGTLHKRKGQVFIVDALSELNKEDRDKTFFSIVGGGPIQAELLEKTKTYGIEKYIRFYGPQENVVPFLDKANIFILPSEEEGMPISILEAMRSGLPIVSTRVGGIPYQVVEGGNGIFIEPSKEGVKQFILHIRDYDWITMGVKSRERYLELFSLSKTIKKYAEILKNA